MDIYTDELSQKFLMSHTALMPMRQVNLPRGAYLQRYFAGSFNDKDVWIHRFLSNDSEQHLHNHGFEFKTIMLRGRYVEEYRSQEDGKTHSRITTAVHTPMSMTWWLTHLPSLEYAHGRHIDVFDWHRIVEADPETWTALIVPRKRIPMWFFKDDNGKLEGVNSSPADWWKYYKVRPDSGVAVDDNRF